MTAQHGQASAITDPGVTCRCGRQFSTARGFTSHLRAAERRGETVPGPFGAEPDAPAPDYSWADAVPVQAAPAPLGAADDLDALGAAMVAGVEAVRALEAHLPAALDYMAASVSDTSVVEFVAWVQDQRRALAALEDTATRYAAQNLSVHKSGTLPDGRLYEVKRGGDRKGWDREQWEHDARAAVLRTRGVPALVVDPIQGDVINLLEVLAGVQAVHGSGPPRVTALRALGLDPDDYSETTPGRWSVAVTNPVQENG